MLGRTVRIQTPRDGEIRPTTPAMGYGQESAKLGNSGEMMAPSMHTMMGSLMKQTPMQPGAPGYQERQDRPSALDRYVEVLKMRRYGPPGQPPPMRGRLG